MPFFYIGKLLVLAFYLLTGCTRINDPFSNPLPSSGQGYPRLAMWWPDTWKQSVDQLKRYDWIGFGDWDNLEAIQSLQTLNPDQQHFMDYSITETSWSWWKNEKKSMMDKIPSEWFLTQQGTSLAQDLDSTRTTVVVESVNDIHGKLLFEIGDLIACEFETMKVSGINAPNRILVVERGTIRSSGSHPAGARIAPHITFWPGSWVMNMSSLCPKIDIDDGNGPQTWAEFACRYRDIENEDTWDGFIVDRIESGQSWLIGTWCRSIDPDCSDQEVTDGYTAFDAAWYQGCAGFLEFLRSVHPGKVLISNTSGAYHQVLNGAIYEGFPGNWDNNKPETYQEWAERAQEENGYIAVSKSEHFPNFSLVETYEDEDMPMNGLDYDNPFEHPDFVPNYQRMRYGLTTTLLGDGYFSYEINTNGHGGLGLMWFDEYDNAGKGRGYLGSPQGDAEIVMEARDGSVWRRVYENGVVLCNPTDARVTVELDGPFRLINGSQVPEVNTGEIVYRVVLKPRDGLILLN